MSLPLPEQEALKKTAADFAAQIKAGLVKTVPRVTKPEARDFVVDQLVTVHGLDRRLFGSGLTSNASD
jgi:hypothetical protein